MKNLFKIIYSLLAVLFIGLQSCDEGFEELNNNPDAVNEPTAEYIFTKAQLDAIDCQYYATNVICAGGFMQHFATYKDVPSLGDRYTWSQGGYPYDYFNGIFPNAVNEIAEVIKAVEEDPEQVNLLSIARIWKVYVMHKITDLYGDIPYSEAAMGYTSTIYTPKYDEQSSIYTDLLSELEEAVLALDDSKASFGDADLIYSGNTVQWRKFAYSLMLRLGSRLSKVDAATSQTWVQKAIAGGVIMDDADVASIPYTDGPQTFNYNPVAYGLLSNDYGTGDGVSNKEGGKLAETFISYLKETNDPRLNVLSIVWVNGVADTSAAIQSGMPNGLIGGSAPENYGSYSEPNPNTLLNYESPFLVITNAETNLLLAEAAVKGWSSTISAEDAYENAVSASMRNWSLYDASAGYISDSKINAYLAQNPFSTGTTEEKLEQINTQYWVSLFPDETEIYSNWRRSGYPLLTPVSVPGNITNGTIPRRLIYPPDEETLNATNWAEAVNRIGGNDFTARVWWDAE
ncbi:MAG: SusD/RagB family nutrient-binding outer membrane lipoprotein [Thalassobius sp.]|nr:SusD/RagB family nutrient-binding outer membrane lipoprotein [Thalassovita sp.]